MAQEASELLEKESSTVLADVISYDDLSDFSDELQQEVRRILEIS